MKYRMDKYRIAYRFSCWVVGVLLSGLCSSFASGGVVFTKMDEHIAFQINDQQFTYPASTQFLLLASKQRKDQSAVSGVIQEDGLLKGIVENHLLALAESDEEHDHSLALYADTFTEYRELLLLLAATNAPF